MTMMTKYQVLLALCSYLSAELERDADRSGEYIRFLDEAAPDSKGGEEHGIYEEFMRIAGEVLGSDTCTFSEGWYLAGRCLYELSWSGRDVDEVLAVFSRCSEEEWEETVLGLSEGYAGYYRCPCCLNLNPMEDDGKYEICGFCGWENDPAQKRDPDLAGGANAMSLNEARESYLRTKADTAED